MKGGAIGFVAASLLFPSGCSDDDEAAPATSAPIGLTQCEGSVVRRVDGGNPSADALPALESAITEPLAAQAAFEQAALVVADRYGAMSVELAEGFGRAWVGENGGAYDVVDIDDFGIVVELSSDSACPTGSELHVSEAGLPLFFFAS